MELRDEQIRINDVTKYRDELFGVAIVSIIIFHYCEGLYLAYDTNQYLKFFSRFLIGVAGSIGVDIFVFLSGLGIYYSLTNSTSIVHFYKKRLKRVVIPYLIFGAVFWYVKDIVISQQSINSFLYDYSLLSFWCEGVRVFWYITFICVLYLISPIVYKSGFKRTLLFCSLWLLFCVLVYIVSPYTFRNIEIALMRGPNFFIGMFFAYYMNQSGHYFSAKKLLFALGLSIPIKVISALGGFAFRRLFDEFYGLFLIVAYIYWRKSLEKDSFRSVFGLLILAGSYSLELYMTHVALRNLMQTLSIPCQNVLNYILMILVSIMLSILLKRLDFK